MFFTTTFTIAVLLVVLALSNVLWLLLMPSKGEKHPVIETITEIERAIKRSEERDEVNWGSMRKQVQQLKMQLSLVHAKQYMKPDDFSNLQDVLDSLYSYVEGNWHLYEMEDDPAVAKKLYSESLGKIKNFYEKKFAFTVLLDPVTEDTQKVDMSKLVTELYRQVQNQTLVLQTSMGFLE